MGARNCSYSHSFFIVLDQLFMNKIVIFFGLIFVLALVVAGFFYWQEQNQKIIGSPDDYTVQETEQGRFVENKKAGIRVKIPDDWVVKKMDIMEGSMVFYSPDAQGYREGKIRVPLKKGCLIEVAVAYKDTDFDEVRKEVKENHQWLAMKSDDYFEIIEINGIPALKNILDCVEIGPSIDIFMIKRSILYGIGISSTSEDIERCSQEFDEFLEGVVIE